MLRRFGGISHVASPPLPSASGHDCVRVLVTLGWMPRAWTEHECLLEKGRLQLPIPLVPSLPSSTIAEIVRASGEATAEFVHALERLRTEGSTG